MFSRSLSAARVTIRDFFHGSLSHRRRSKKTCWREQADEWGRAASKNEVSQEEERRKESKNLQPKVYVY
ncbi:hypothetical protein E5D57_001255 [Metarhizium anisopliae]|nr:hypothetical protein E5D57_001255 [Metarhizium anisopliae]